jgi:hypothetical protein
MLTNTPALMWRLMFYGQTHGQTRFVCLFPVLRPAQESFTYMETSPKKIKGCKISVYDRRSGPLSREGSLSCHTCCNMEPRFLRSHPKDRPIKSPLTTYKGMGRTYSIPHPKEFDIGFFKSEFLHMAFSDLFKSKFHHMACQNKECAKI